MLCISSLGIYYYWVYCLPLFTTLWDRKTCPICPTRLIKSGDSTQTGNVNGVCKWAVALVQLNYLSNVGMCALHNYHPYFFVFMLFGTCLLYHVQVIKVCTPTWSIEVLIRKRGLILIIRKLFTTPENQKLGNLQPPGFVGSLLAAAVLVARMVSSMTLNLWNFWLFLGLWFGELWGRPHNAPKRQTWWISSFWVLWLATVVIHWIPHFPASMNI